MTEDIKTAETKPVKLNIRKIVLQAIKNLKEPNGATFGDIKGYIAANNNNFDEATHEKLIQTYLMRAAKNGTLVRIPKTSSGSNGKFKLAEKEKAIVKIDKITKGAQKKPSAVTKKPIAVIKKPEVMHEEKLKKIVKKMHLSQTGYMVLHAICNLKEYQKGSTLTKIRRYITLNFNVSMRINFNYVTKKFVSQCLKNGILVSTNDNGFNGRFKIVSYLLNIIKKKIEGPMPKTKKRVLKETATTSEVETSNKKGKKKAAASSGKQPEEAKKVTKKSSAKKAVTKPKKAKEQSASAEEAPKKVNKKTKVANAEE